jgi:hypothetical protein
VKNGPVAPPLGFIHPASPCQPRTPGARSGSPEETKVRESSRKAPARLVGPICRRERERERSSSSSHRLPCGKSLTPISRRPMRSFHAAKLMSSARMHACSPLFITEPPHLLAFTTAVPPLLLDHVQKHQHQWRICSLATTREQRFRPAVPPSVGGPATPPKDDDDSDDGEDNNNDYTAFYR